jgi:MOSC domain-containing protein YiiM
MRSKIVDIYCGQESIIDDGKREPYKSSYKKIKVDTNDTLIVKKDGIVGDNQSDKINHGGVDKAVCLYSQKSYDFFIEEYGYDLPECAFGENIKLADLDDSEICIGDRYSLGSVVFEVSQPRQPCWKISSIIGIKNLTSTLVKAYKSGFYFRVIQEGSIKPTDSLELIDRKYPKYTIEYINRASLHAKDHQDEIRELLKVDAISDAYKESLQKRLDTKADGIEDWQRD